MINHQSTIVKEITDAELVSRSLAGDREAFSGIVSRYQILICSVAYNRLGNLGQSEDVAQETFITAWKQLGLLREPEKLRSWLCGIVRNRLYKHCDREIREPASQAESLEEIHESPAGEALPSEQAISREEEAILWRSLEKIPESYREPLILFYRENQSVSQVAAALELTEDTVKQRLSRGRKLLQEEVQTFVEKTLRRTAPSQNFSGLVLAALPTSTATVSAGAIGKGTMMAKSGFLGAGLVALAPFIGLVAGLLSQWFFISATSTGRARRMKLIEMTGFFILIPGLAMMGEFGVNYLSHRYGWNDTVYYLARTGFWWCFAVALAAWLVAQLRKMQAIHGGYGPAGETAPEPNGRLKPFAHALAIAGTQITMFAWLIAIAYRFEDAATAVILTGCMIGLGVWNFLSVRAPNGPAVVRAVTQQMALYGVIVLLTFNLRLDVWMATARHASRAEIHALFSPWILPSLTLAFVAWIALLWLASKPKTV